MPGRGRKRRAPPEEVAYAHLSSAEVYFTRGLLELMEGKRALLASSPNRDHEMGFGPGSAVYHVGPPRFLGLVLPDAPPKIEAKWGGWPGLRVYAEARDYWYLLVKAALAGGLNAELLGGWEPFREATVMLAIRAASPRAWDPDNYAIRFILNALQHEGILEGDTYNRMVLAVFGLPGEPPATGVAIWEDRDLLVNSVLGRPEAQQFMAKLESLAGNPAS